MNAEISPVGGEMVKALLSRYFQFQDFPNSHDVFFFATEIVDLIFTLSVIRHNEFRPYMVAEAKRASKAYVRQYLPEELPPLIR